MIINKKMVFVAIALAMLISCSNDDASVLQTDKRELGISAITSANGTIGTRGLMGEFNATNKDINVFVAGTGYTSKVAVYSFGSPNWSAPVKDADKIYLSGEIATVYGYFPEITADKVDLTAKTIGIKVVDMQDFNATEQTDYMYATGRKNEGTTELPSYTYPLATATNKVNNNENNVDLYFHHALSQLSFVVKRSDSYTGTGKLTSVVLSKAAAFLTGDGLLPLDGSKISGLTVTDKITLANSGGVVLNSSDAITGVTVNGLVAPVTLPDYVISTDANDNNSIKLIFTIDDKPMCAYLSTKDVTQWEAGKIYTYTITVMGTKLSVASVCVVNWLDGGTDSFVVN